MTKETFTAKAYPSKMLSALFALGSILVLFSSYNGFVHLPFGEWSRYLTAILFIILASILWKIPPQKIEVDDWGIKKLNNSRGFISSFLQPDTECEWNWINSISTIRRPKNDSFVTVLYISEDIPNQPKYRVTIESMFFKDYVSILKIIKARAPQAKLDETTASILNGHIDIYAIKPYHYLLVIIVALIIMVLLLNYGKG